MTNKNFTNIIVPTRSSMPSMEEYMNEIKSLWDSRWLSNDGVIHQKFVAELKKYLDIENLELFSNGHMALEIAIAGMDLKGEVITTPFTFISTLNAIERNGLTPVFCDINADDFNMDVSKIESLITEKTSAIVPVHIYGNPCDVYAIDKLAKKYNLKVIYDAAQCFGVTVDGKSVGSFGDASMFSFHATKTFHTVEGGAIVYQDKELEDIYSKIANHITVVKGEKIFTGLDAKMNELEAAMGICNLRHIDEYIGQRTKLYERYKMRLKDILGINTVPVSDGVVQNHTYMPTIVDSKKHGASRDEILKALFDQNIYAGKYFAPLMIEHIQYKERFKDLQLPVARYVEANILALPMYEDMTLEDVDKICDTIKSTQKL